MTRALRMPSRPLTRMRPPWYMPAFGWNRQSMDARNLIGWYLPVPGTPPTWVDIVTGRLFTLGGSGADPTYVLDPELGPAIDFAGTKYYTLDLLPPLVTGGSPYPFTAVAWIKLTNTTGTKGIAGVGDTSTSKAMWIGISGATTQMRSDDGTGTSSSQIGTLSSNVWSLVAGSIRSDTGRESFYLRGLGTNATSRVVNALARIVIGANANSLGSPFVGRIADVRFFRVRFAATRVMNLSSYPTSFDLYNWMRHPASVGEVAAAGGQKFMQQAFVAG